MNLVLTYCTTGLFSRGLVPLVALAFRESAAQNDNGPSAAKANPPDPTVLLERSGNRMFPLLQPA
jgi:hypothetical protein